MKKKFDINYLMLCDYALQDSKGKISLIGVFENFNVQQLPASIASFVVAGNFTIHDDDIKGVKIELDIKDPKNKSIGTNLPSLNIDYIPAAIEGGKRKVNFLFTLNALPFTEKGNHIFKVLVNKEEVGSLNLEIRIIN